MKPRRVSWTPPRSTGVFWQGGRQYVTRFDALRGAGEIAKRDASLLARLAEE